MNLKEKRYLLLDLDGVCYGKHNNYPLEKVFGQVSNRMTQFISEKLKINLDFQHARLLLNLILHQIFHLLVSFQEMYLNTLFSNHFFLSD